MNSKTGQHHKTEEREEEQECGLRKTERKQDPREPSAEERLEHEKRICHSGVGAGIA